MSALWLRTPQTVSTVNAAGIGYGTAFAIAKAMPHRPTV